MIIPQILAAELGREYKFACVAEPVGRLLRD